MKYLRLALYFGLSLFSYQLSAQLFINELCPSNDQIIEDEFGDSSDWIELYNANENTITLGGYFLSDDPTEPNKWALPNQELGAGEWLLIFASDRDLTGTYLHTNFKLSAAGESVVLSKSDGSIVDQITYQELNTDESLGRLQDGSADWALFASPTPGFTNNNSGGSGFTASPEWITTDYFFPEPSLIELSHSNPAAQIFFTRDGSQPDADDELYTGAFQLDTTTAIRAVAIAPGLLPSKVITRTFFIDSKHVLPIVSIVGEPAAFWSWENGILVDGGPNAEEEWPYWGANYWADIEIPIHFEFLSPDQGLLFSELADTKVHGGRGARTNAMKPLRILFKKKYGTNTVEYPFFEERERTTYKRLVLRNASGDYNHGHFRDAFLGRYFITEGLNIDALAHRPVAVYINGEYYGLENLREKSDEYYLQHNYGIDPDNLDLLEEDTIIAIGDLVLFDSMLNYVLTNNMQQEENFEQASYFFDVENIAEGFIVQSALNNNDWLVNNIKYWRERKEGARWRYIIFDLDSGMGRHGWSRASENNLTRFLAPESNRTKHTDLIVALLENDNYRYYFLNRYADLLNTSFRSEIFRKEVDFTVEEIEPEMPIHFSRWTWPGFDVWRNDRVENVYNYVAERPPYARQHLREHFDLSGEVQLELKTYPEGAGLIKINTITPEQLPWNGIYFKGVPVTLTIEPAPGYTFSHWLSDKTISEPNVSTSINYDFQEDDTITAFFAEAATGIQLQAFLTQDNSLSVEAGLDFPQELTFSLFDISGRLIQTYPSQFLSGGNQRITLSTPYLSSGIYLLQARSERKLITKKMIKF